MDGWEEIVNQHGPPAYRTAWRILRHPEDCEDVLQDVFLEAHQWFVAGKVQHWRTFLSRMVTYRALDRLRRRKQTTPLDHLFLLDTSPDPSDVASDREEAARLRELVTELPERQAAVFCLAHFEGLSHTEIAAALDITSNAVANALHKARQTLRQMVEATRKGNQI